MTQTIDYRAAINLGPLCPLTGAPTSYHYPVTAVIIHQSGFGK